MAEYRLLVKPSAAKEIEAIGTKRDRQRIVGRIQSLAAKPRQGHYRVIYTIDDANHTVIVIKVGHRREVYRSAP